MSRSFTIPVATILSDTGARAQAAGTTTLGVAGAKLEVVASGWSAKRQILGKTVCNEDSEQVGKIDDLIVAPDTAVSFVVIDASGFVGVKRHQVAIPAGQLSERNGLIVLRGATKAAIKALPSFEYRK